MTQISRRHYLAASGALVAAAFAPRPAFAQTTIRQGYQTNLWGMPTYYLLRSGLLEKRGIKFEEFGVPSGNLTMQQMVARQVDMGTYAGPSLILGHDKGGLVAVAQIEHVGKTASVMVRKDLGHTKIEQLKGLKIANQTGSSVGNIFVDQIAPKHGLKKGDYQEVRMDVNNMITALSAKTVDVMVNVEPYNAIAEADGLAVKIMNYWDVDKMPVFMAATPDFIAKSPGDGRHLSQGVAGSREGLQERAEQGRRRDLFVLHLQRLLDVAGDLPQGNELRGRRPRLPAGPQALHAGAGRDPAEGEEDRRDPGLEQGAAPGLHGEGTGGGVMLRAPQAMQRV